MIPDRVSLTGIYGEIRLLIQESPDRFRAFSDEGRFLLELDAEGADQVLAADPFRIRVNLKPS